MIALGRAFGLLRSLAWPLLLVNAFYFGLVGTGMAYGAWDRSTHEEVTRSITRQAPESLPEVFRAYREGHVVSAIALTFAVNLVGGSLLFITLPSLVIPFSGLLAGGSRAVLWGIIFAPDFSDVTAAGVTRGLLIGLLILLEGEGYVLAVLASYVQGRAFVQPASVGASGHWQGYRIGVVRSAQLYLFVAGTLAVAAVYEAVLAILILPFFK